MPPHRRTLSAVVFIFQPTIDILVNSTFGDEAGDLFRWRRGEVEQLVGPHVLLAAETLAAGVAEVEAGHVAPLVDGQVVRLGERPGAPPAVVGLAHRPDLQGFFPVAGFLLVHFDTEADCKHLVFQICGPVVIRSPRT